MTPAEKPKLTERNLGFVFLARRAIKLPIPVARPAMVVNKKANRTLGSIGVSFYPNFTI